MPRIPDTCTSALYPRRFRFVRVPIRVLLLFTCPQSLFTRASAQTAAATLRETVTDQAGAVISGVNIALMRLAREFQRSTTASDEGIFVVPLLQRGNHTVWAQSSKSQSDVWSCGQDMWRLTPRLPFTHGVLWDVNPDDRAPMERDNWRNNTLFSLPYEGPGIRSAANSAPARCRPATVTKSTRAPPPIEAFENEEGLR
jgi:hypothetical protein